MRNNRVVFLNPPGKALYIRDNYCSKISQANYINHPIDFVILSGILRNYFNLYLFDSIVSNLNQKKTLEILKDLSPHAIFILTGVASWKEDKDFISQLKKFVPESKIILLGDVFLENNLNILNEIYFDAILLDYYDKNIIDFLLNNNPDSDYLITPDNLIPFKNKKIKKWKSVSIPVPKHELFVHLPYKYPFLRHLPFATIQTEYGCPFNCKFCVMASLDHKIRTIENVEEELKYLQILGIRELFIIDQTFGSNIKRGIEICKLLSNFTPKFSWLTFTRPDLLIDDFLIELKKAGCHTLIMGVESANPQLLQNYNKGYNLKQIKNAFLKAKKFKITTVATFIFGLPGDTKESILQTIDFAKQINADFYSLNFAIPRPGTQLRQIALNSNLIDQNQIVMDQSGFFLSIDTPQLSKSELEKLKKLALKKLYFNVPYILKRLTNISNKTQFIIQLKNAFYLLKRWINSN